MGNRPAPDSARAAPRLVGRAGELKAIAGVVADVSTGGSRFLLVGGDAGLGKTTLVAAAAEDVGSGVLVLRGQCVPLGGEGLPFAPVTGILHDLSAVLGPDQLLDWAGGGRRALSAVVPDLVQPDDGGVSSQLQLFEAIARVLGQVAQTSPLMIIVEDLHWADASTRQLLLFLAGALREQPVAVIGTFRPDEIGRRHPMRDFLGEAGRLPRTTRLDLRPLDRAATAQLVESVLGRPSSAAAVADIQQRSGGIPFYVRELAAWADASTGMPSTVRDAVHARLARLSDEASAIVRIAAVLGDRVPHEALVALADRSEAQLEPHLREAVDVGVFTMDHEAYLFRHALLREAVEEDLLPGERARLHRLAATTLEAQPQLSGESVPHVIALHWAAGRDHEKAFLWSLRAARSGTAAHSEALKMYERVLELWDVVPDPAAEAGSYGGLLEAAARTAKDAGDYDRALRMATQALTHTDDHDHRGRFSRLMLRLHLLIDLIRPGAEAAATEAAALLDQLDDASFRAHALEQLAAYHLNTGGDGRPLAKEAVAAAGALGDRVLEATARNTLGSLLILTGADDEGLSELSRAGQLLEARVDGVAEASDLDRQRAVVRYHLNYSDALQATGQYAAARDQALAGVRAARAYGLERAFGSFVAGNAAESLIALGQLSEATELLEEALRLDPPTMSATHLHLMTAWTRLWRGDLTGAESVMAPLRTLLSEPQPKPETTADAIRVDAELAIFTGQPERAWSHFLYFRDHRELYDPHRSMAIMAVVAAAATELDQRQPAQRRDQVHRLAEALPLTRMHAIWTPVIDAELADTADRWAELVQSLDGDPRAPAHLRPYARWRWARHLAQVRDRSAAREVITAAFTEADALGLQLLTSRLAPLAAQVGTSLSASRGSGPLAALTSREIEVLKLVAAGRSNAQIGEALFISSKTASVHVSNILAKLGVDGRGAASAVAHREGLI